MKIEIIALCLLILLTSVILWHSFSLLYKIIRSKKWIITEATLEMIDLRYYYEHDSESGGKRLQNAISLNYQYDYNGKFFNNDKLYFGNSFLQNKKINKKIYELLEHAQTVQIYVNPNKPTDSVMIRALVFPMFLSFTVGIFWLIMSIKLIDHIYEAGRFTDSHDHMLLGLFISIFVIAILSHFLENILDYITVLKYK